MLLSTSQYLPSEALKFSNYPELYTVLDSLNQFQTMLNPIMLAVSDYDSGVEDYIYVDISALRAAINLSFTITDVLGRATNVCFDVLLPIRDAQEALNELIFSYQYEKSPVVLDRDKTNLQRINNVSTQTTINTIS